MRTGFLFLTPLLVCVACGGADGSTSETLGPNSIAASNETREALGVVGWSLDGDEAHTVIRGFDDAQGTIVEYRYSTDAQTREGTTRSVDRHAVRFRGVTAALAIAGGDEPEMLLNTVADHASDFARVLALLGHDIDSAGPPTKGSVLSARLRPASPQLTDGDGPQLAGDCYDRLVEACAEEKRSLDRARENTMFECLECRGGILELTCGDCLWARHKEIGTSDEFNSCTEHEHNKCIQAKF